MTDSLKERLRDLAERDYREYDPTTGEAFEPGGRTIMEALARIEGLEKDRAYYGQLYKEQHDIDKATIAKLEADLAALEEWIEEGNNLRAEIAKLEAENVRLKQESNYWQMAAMHANEREEEAQERLRRKGK